MGATLRDQLGSIDIYWFDQLLRGRVARDARILDAGCGAGRNLVYLLRHGFDVHGVDHSPDAIEAARRMARQLVPDLPAERRFVQGDVTALPFADASFDVVLCCAVLHFAEDDDAFLGMIDELGRVLAPGGFLFARLASTIGIEDRIEPIGPNRFRLPDGTDRYLVDEARLLELTQRLGGTLADPIKTTNVQGQRCMTTWCVKIP